MYIEKTHGDSIIVDTNVEPITSKLDVYIKNRNDCHKQLLCHPSGDVKYSVGCNEEFNLTYICNIYEQNDEEHRCYLTNEPNNYNWLSEIHTRCVNHNKQ